MFIAIIANPRVKTRNELLRLAQEFRNAEIAATIVIGTLGLDPEEYAELLPNPYFLSGAEDDIRVTKQARKLNALLDGNVVEINNVVVAGVGGIDPHQNMERVLKLIAAGVPSKRIDITLSYHPPRGCGDLIETLKVRRGLDELRTFIEKIRPSLHICDGEYVDTCLINDTKTYVLGKGEAYALIRKDRRSITSRMLPLRRWHNP